MKDFFISYNSSDKDWAEWIAWTLEEAGYAVVLQDWDFRPAENFVLRMQQATIETSQMIAVLSDNYLKATFTQSEWASAFAADPTGGARKLLPIRVKECSPRGLLAAIIHIDLVGLSEPDAKLALLNAFKQRAKPAFAPNYPGSKQSSKTVSERVAPDVKPYPGLLLPEGGKDEPADPNTGSIVSRSCDRTPQQDTFEETFKRIVQNYSRYPQLYVVHGPARERHKSLVKRFQETTIQDYADFISSVQKASVSLWDLGWSYKLDIESAKQQLIELLILRRYNDSPKYRFQKHDYSAAAFRKDLASLLNSVIVIQHTIETEKWTPTTAKLISAYLEFWDEVRKGVDIPQCLIFLNIVYPQLTRASLWNLWKKLDEIRSKYEKKQITRALKKICPPPDRQPVTAREQVFCFYTLLDELPCVNISHLERWFEKHNMGKNEVAWETQSRNIFRMRGWGFDECKNMADIEDVLDEFIDVVRKQS